MEEKKLIKKQLLKNMIYYAQFVAYYWKRRINMKSNEKKYKYLFDYENSKISVLEDEENSKYNIVAITNGLLDLDKAIEFTKKYFDAVLVLSLERKGISVTSDEYKKKYFSDSVARIDTKRQKVIVNTYNASEIRKNYFDEYYMYEENLRKNNKYKQYNRK